MFRLALLAVVFGALVPTDVRAENVAEQALKLVTSYHEDRSRIDRARELLEAALQRERRVDTMVALARVCLLAGDVRATSADEKLALYDRGREIGRRAIELEPRNEAAHLWYVANTGRWGQTKGVLRSLFLLPTMREELDTILSLNPRSAPGHAIAGRFLYEVPALLGGDRQKAEEHLRTALKIDPHYTLPRVDLAELLHAGGRDAEARRELERVLAERTPTSIADWTVKDVPRARELLGSIRARR